MITETRSVHGIINNLFMLEKVDESHSERAWRLFLKTTRSLACFIFYDFNYAVELL